MSSTFCAASSSTAILNRLAALYFLLITFECVRKEGRVLELTAKKRRRRRRVAKVYIQHAYILIIITTNTTAEYYLMRI